MTLDKKIKVLHVEDQVFCVKSTDVVLKKMFNYESALTEQEGLEKLIEKKYDFVITDGSLESNHGEPDFETGKRIAKAAKEQGAYVIGVSSEPEAFKKFAGQYINYNHKKPLDLIKLINLIKEEYKNKST